MVGRATALPTAPNATHGGTPVGTHVACLCAAWCRLCDDYRKVLREVGAALATEKAADLAAATASAMSSDLAWPWTALHWHWIDIEDEADLLGEVDVETFPTLVIADAAAVRFAGPVMPQHDTLRRLLRVTVVDAQADERWPAVDPAIEAFAARLRQRPGDTI
ncbi:MAG: thioredoxin [Rubrivivax sp.]|nr:thioredoxin [Rubrivivax sp.]